MKWNTDFCYASPKFLESGLYVGGNLSLNEVTKKKKKSIKLQVWIPPYLMSSEQIPENIDEN